MERRGGQLTADTVPQSAAPCCDASSAPSSCFVLCCAVVATHGPLWIIPSTSTVYCPVCHDGILAHETQLISFSLLAIASPSRHCSPLFLTLPRLALSRSSLLVAFY